MTKTHPKVSVILPTFDRARELPAALASVLQQDFSDLELIVVDDASSDETAELPCLRGDPRIRYVALTQRSGGGAARNRGLELARGEWVAFQDSDDRWHAGKLSRQLAALQEARSGDPDFAAIFCRYRRLLPGSKEQIEPAAESIPEDGDLLEALLYRSLIGTPTLIAQREMLERVGGFDASIPRFQDWELAIRIAADSKIAFLDEILVDAGHSANRLTTGHDRTLIEAEARILEKHGDRMAAAGAECIAYRYWHLSHLQFMAGDRDAARRSLAEAQRLQPRFDRRLMGWIGLSPALYRGAYSLARAFR